MLNPEIALCKMVIYKIENKLNGKIYVGQTSRTLKERISEHLRKGRLSYIDRAIRYYGIENFFVEIIEHCGTVEELNEREIFWIAELNCKFPNGYNLTDGGEGSNGYKATPEISAKLSLMRKGRKNTPEQRAKISAKLKGKIFDEETKAKISKSKMGHSVSEETRKKLRAANLGKKATPETKAKMSAASVNKRSVRCIELGKIFESITSATNFLTISRSKIITACRNSERTAGSYHWEYVK